MLTKRNIKKFLLIVVPITVIALLIAFTVTFFMITMERNRIYSLADPYNKGSSGTINTASPVPNVTITEGGSEAPSPTPATDEGGLLLPPAKTNVLVYGIDENNLTDAMMIASFERDTGAINVLSIPRDTYIQIPEQRLERMRANGLHPPSSGVMKINSLRSYGRAYGVQYLQEQLCEMLGIDIHYFVEIELEAFRALVDLLGGVTIEVPYLMHYEDPEQDLLINIPPGIYNMDGKMAEGLVRYRSYADGDADRVTVQRQFITQLFRQTLKRENLLSNPLELINIGIRYVKTDIGTDIVRYIRYINSLSPDKFFTYTLPGAGEYVGAVSYFLPDINKVAETVNEVFYSTYIEKAPPVGQPSQGLRIAVQNGSRFAGLAMSMGDRLSMDGYNVVSTGNYSGEQENRTRIYVKEDGKGQDLLPYFKNAVIIVDRGMSDSYDILIIIGRSEER